MVEREAHTSCMLDKLGYMHTPTRLSTRTHARQRTHTHVIFIAFSREQ